MEPNGGLLEQLLKTGDWRKNTWDLQDILATNMANMGRNVILIDPFPLVQGVYCRNNCCLFCCVLWDQSARAGNPNASNAYGFVLYLWLTHTMVIMNPIPSGMPTNVVGLRWSKHHQTGQALGTTMWFGGRSNLPRCYVYLYGNPSCSAV